MNFPGPFAFLAPLALIAVFRAASPAAPIPITGPMTHRESFDGLGSGDVPWIDDSTLPGWLAEINDGTTPAGNAQAADGNTVLSGLLNLGAPGAADRALGSKSTSTDGFANIAIGVQFQNSGAEPIRLSQLTYTGELWRTNSTAGNTEFFAVFYAVSPTQITDLISGGTGSTAVAGTGFSTLGAAANWSAPVNTPASTARDGNAPANRRTITFAPASSISIPPGQFLVIKWTDPNISGTDGFQGIDDLAVTFAGVAGVLTPAVSNFTRDLAATPANPADDTFGFTVSVTGTGAVGSGWTTTGVAPPNATSASYGTSVAWTGFPVAAPKTVTFTDNTNPAINAAITVSAPAIIGTNETIAPGTPILSTGPVPAEWVVNQAARTLTMNAGTATDSVVIADLDLSATGAANFSATMTLAEISIGSNLETTDRFKLELVIDTAIQNLITAWDVGDGASAIANPGPNGPPDGYLNGYEGNAGTDVITQVVYDMDIDDYNANRDRDEFNLNLQPATDQITGVFPLRFAIPAEANSVQIRIYGAGFSGSETVTVSGITLSVPNDSDGDGVSNSDETIMGTHPNDPLDVTRLSQSTISPTIFTFPTENLRFYKVFVSNDLASWTDSGLPAITGDGTTKQINVNDLPARVRRFFRLQVSQ
jgi:hypothetical protein